MSWLGGSVVLSAWPKGRARPLFPQAHPHLNFFLPINHVELERLVFHELLDLGKNLVCWGEFSGTMKVWQNLLPWNLVSWPVDLMDVMQSIDRFLSLLYMAMFIRTVPYNSTQNSKHSETIKPFRGFKKKNLKNLSKKKIVENFQKFMTWRITIDPPEEQSAQSQNSLAYDSPRSNPWQNISDYEVLHVWALETFGWAKDPLSNNNVKGESQCQTIWTKKMRWDGQPNLRDETRIAPSCGMCVKHHSWFQSSKKK